MYSLLAIPVRLILALIGLAAQVLDFINWRKRQPEPPPQNTPEFEKWLRNLEELREEKVRRLEEEHPELAEAFDRKARQIIEEKRKRGG
jgi:hypothetical protein